MSAAEIKWQCRRGMRELDVLLGGWFEHRYADASESQKSAFRKLLTLPDPVLVEYLLSGKPVVEAELTDVVATIRSGNPVG